MFCEAVFHHAIKNSSSLNKALIHRYQISYFLRFSKSIIDVECLALTALLTVLVYQFNNLWS